MQNNNIYTKWNKSRVGIDLIFNDEVIGFINSGNEKEAFVDELCKRKDRHFIKVLAGPRIPYRWRDVSPLPKKRWSGDYHQFGIQLLSGSFTSFSIRPKHYYSRIEMHQALEDCVFKVWCGLEDYEWHVPQGGCWTNYRDLLEYWYLIELEHPL